MAWLQYPRKHCLSFSIHFGTVGELFLQFGGFSQEMSYEPAEYFHWGRDDNKTLRTLLGATLITVWDLIIG